MNDIWKWHELNSRFLFFKLIIDYVAFGPHGPREPITKPGHNGKVFGGVVATIAASAALFYVIRMNGKFFFKLGMK